MDTPVAQTITAADGSFHLEGFSPGRFILVAGSPIASNGLPPRSFAAQVVAQTVDPMKMDLSLDLKGGLAIRGKIGVIGLSVPPPDVGMTVSVMPRQDGKVRNQMANPSFKYDAKDGTFEISELFPGLYGLTANLQLAGFCAGTGTGLLVSQADVTGVEMMMSVGCQ
jgi:hypothetical protein